MNNYYNEIRSDIAKEFGLEAGGFAPAPKQYMTVRQYQILNNKYPATGSTRWDIVPNPKAVAIAKRYNAIMSILMKGN